MAPGQLPVFKRLSQPPPKSTQGRAYCTVQVPSAANVNSAQRVLLAPDADRFCEFTSTLDTAFPTYCRIIACTDPPLGEITWNVTRPLKSWPRGNITDPKPPKGWLGSCEKTS